MGLLSHGRQGPTYRCLRVTRALGASRGLSGLGTLPRLGPSLVLRPIPIRHPVQVDRK